MSSKTKGIDRLMKGRRVEWMKRLKNDKESYFGIDLGVNQTTSLISIVSNRLYIKMKMIISMSRTSNYSVGQRSKKWISSGAHKEKMLEEMELKWVK